MLVTAVDGLAAKGISRVVKVHHGHVVVVDACNHSHMPDLVRVAPAVKETGELLFGESVSVEQKTGQVGQPRLEEGEDKVPGVGEALHVGNISQGYDARASHAQEDEDAKVAERWQVKEWIQGQNAAHDTHAETERQKDPALSVTEEAIVEGGHDRGSDQDADANVVERGGTSHYGQP